MNNIYIPSYNRSNQVRTYEYLEQGYIVVPESQEKEYRKKYGKAVLAIPDDRDGSVARKRNAILDLIKEKTGSGWMIDDDLECLRRKKENTKISGQDALEHFERIELMAKDGEFMFAGFDYSGDNMKLKDMSPFSFNKIFFGCVYVDARDDIKYDERFSICEDVDYFLQKMERHRRVLKDNQYQAMFFGEDGGENSVIRYDQEKQKEFAKIINKKWGYGAMVWKGTGFRFYNPIKGV